MPSALAQLTAFPTSMPAVRDVLDQVEQSADVPTPTEYVDWLGTLGWVEAAAMIVFGLIYLLYGWRIFKLLVIVNALLIGGFVGAMVGGQFQAPHAPLWGAAAGALGLAILAWPLMKGAVALMAGLAGAAIAYGVWTTVMQARGDAEMLQYAWIAAIAGGVLFAGLGYFLLRLFVIVFTCVQGSWMAVSGTLVLLMKSPSIAEQIEAFLTGSAHALPALIAAPAAVGFLLQAVFTHRHKKRRAARDLDDFDDDDDYDD